MGYDVTISPTFIRTFYRRLILAGFTSVEAGNVVAKLMGLAASQKGWKVSELVELLFVEYMDKKNGTNN